SLFLLALAALDGVRGHDASAEQANLIHNRARMQSQLGNVPLADSLMLEAIARQRTIHGERSAEVGVTLAAHGLLQLQHGALAEAEASLREALAIQRAAFGRDRPETAHTLSRLATALEQQG